LKKKSVSVNCLFDIGKSNDVFPLSVTVDEKDRFDVEHRVGARDEFIETELLPAPTRDEEQITEHVTTTEVEDLDKTAQLETLEFVTNETFKPEPTGQVGIEQLTRTDVTIAETPFDEESVIDHRVGPHDDFIETSAASTAKDVYEEEVMTVEEFQPAPEKIADHEILEVTTTEKHIPDTTDQELIDQITREELTSIDHRVGPHDDYVQTQVEDLEVTERDVNQEFITEEVTEKHVPSSVPAEELASEVVAYREQMDLITVDMFSPELTAPLSADQVSKATTIEEIGKCELIVRYWKTE
jgi:hypothetical protein